jgi:poly(3-hydroxybutyrate) depolymerase
VSSLLSIVAAASLLPGFSHYAAGPAGGSVQTGVFPGEQRPGFVYLPPEFTRSRRYAVVYLLHGMPGTPTEYLQGTDLANWADTEIEQGLIRPFIAVLPAAGPDPRYNGEWAGRIAAPLVSEIVPWIDERLPTLATRRGRVIAGLSAGGFGAVDIGLRHPELFGTIEAWSAYFSPLHDGPFEHAPQKVLAENDPTKLAPSLASTLRRDHTRFFLSTGPGHSHWFRPEQTRAFLRELRSLGVTATYHVYANAKGEWRAQVDTGLAWALPTG